MNKHKHVEILFRIKKKLTFWGRIKSASMRGASRKGMSLNSKNIQAGVILKVEQNP